jgi:hypothetical protein
MICNRNNVGDQVSPVCTVVLARRLSCGVAVEGLLFCCKENEQVVTRLFVL